MKDIKYFIKLWITWIPIRWSQYQSLRHINRVNKLSRWLFEDDSY